MFAVFTVLVTCVVLVEGHMFQLWIDRCNGIEYNDKNQICCDKKLYDRQTGTEECCHWIMYDTETHICCYEKKAVFPKRLSDLCVKYLFP